MSYPLRLHVRHAKVLPLKKIVVNKKLASKQVIYVRNILMFGKSHETCRLPVC